LLTLVTSLGGVQNALYRCDQVAVTSGADSLVAVKSTQATDGSLVVLI
jgi:hypothetical protein